ncbi:hypothetical protein JB92DRAFT_472042 [Gautieria morchelliformis]|nr:hypothetical protein JB92DRAFT_472042 [Gautieria morchelliformis]
MLPTHWTGSWPNMYSSFSSTLSLSLFILLVLGSCACRTPQSFLSPGCLSNGTDVWWKPLEWKGHDPCALSHNLQQQNNAKAHIGCCSVPVQSVKSSHTRRRRRGQTPPCGPCNLQTYNIAAACLACTQPSTLTASTAVVQSEIANKSLPLPTSQQWSAGRDQ